MRKSRILGGVFKMITRKEKREREKNKNYFFELMKTQRHFFKDFNKWLGRIKDSRHQSYITYDSDILLMMIILKNACDLRSMRTMTNEFNKEEAIENIKKILNMEELSELPHYDTINDYLSTVQPSELENIITFMIKELLKKRCFDDYRINGKYWGVVFDGTGLFSFDKKHCEHCLRREYTDKETGEVKVKYMHHVLEAKLVVGDMVLSIGSEFIENESENISKQDCELKAFHRLAKKVKENFKRLPICILGDSLYACESVFKKCDEYRWHYLFRFKQGRIKSIAEDFQAIKQLEQQSAESNPIFWTNDIAYNQRTVNMIEYESEKRFTYITNIKITSKNSSRLVNAGRSRWKIENEGFNRQKNVRYHIEHPNSHNYTAMRNHYLLTQITDILMQLFEKGSKFLKTFKKTMKEISANLLEAIRTRILTDNDMTLMAKPIQIRFP